MEECSRQRRPWVLSSSHSFFRLRSKNIPKSSLNRPQIDPRRSQIDPWGPKVTQEVPRRVLRASQEPSRDPPRWSRGVPRSPQGRPRRPQETHKVAQDSPEAPTRNQNRSQNGPKIDSDAQFGRKQFSRLCFDRFLSILLPKTTCDSSAHFEQKFCRSCWRRTWRHSVSLGKTRCASDVYKKRFERKSRKLDRKNLRKQRRKANRKSLFDEAFSEPISAPKS